MINELENSRIITGLLAVEGTTPATGQRPAEAEPQRGDAARGLVSGRTLAACDVVEDDDRAADAARFLRERTLPQVFVADAVHHRLVAGDGRFQLGRRRGEVDRQKLTVKMDRQPLVFADRLTAIQQLLQDRLHMALAQPQFGDACSDFLIRIFTNQTRLNANGAVIAFLSNHSQ